MAKGGVKERFVEKGFVRVSGKQDGGKFDPDEALMAAIEGNGIDSSPIPRSICDCEVVII